MMLQSLLCPWSPEVTDGDHKNAGDKKLSEAEDDEREQGKKGRSGGNRIGQGTD